MTGLLLYLLILLCSPILIFLVHIVIARVTVRFKLPVQPLLTGVLAVVLTLPGMAAAALALKMLSAASLVYGILTYLCLAFCYFQVFAMTETARRLRILYELYTHGPMSSDQLSSVYGAAQMMVVRLERMVEIGQLHYDGTHYRLRRSFLLRVGQIMAFWAWALGFKGK